MYNHQNPVFIQNKDILLLSQPLYRLDTHMFYSQSCLFLLSLKSKGAYFSPCFFINAFARRSLVSRCLTICSFGYFFIIHGNNSLFNGMNIFTTKFNLRIVPQSFWQSLYSISAVLFRCDSHLQNTLSCRTRQSDRHKR